MERWRLTQPDAYTRFPDDSGTVHLRPGFLDDLATLNLRGFGDWMAFEGGRAVDRNRKRNVVEVRLGKTYFLKRFHHPPLKDFLGLDALRGGAPTHARMELRAAEDLAAAGIGTYPIVGYGEARSGWARPSFLITEELRGYRPLHRVLEEGGADFRRMAEDLADLVRRMHRAGITHPDLYATHIYLRIEGEGTSWRLIDLHRVRKRRGGLSRFDQVRDLTALHLTCTGPAVTRADRLRFLCRCLGREGTDPVVRRVAGKILKRAERLWDRGRYRALRGEKG
jgi:tRNA A-37 threonylcarbamoyl transferase component Bud32